MESKAVGEELALLEINEPAAEETKQQSLDEPKLDMNTLSKEISTMRGLIESHELKITAVQNQVKSQKAILNELVPPLPAMPVYNERTPIPPKSTCIAMSKYYELAVLQKESALLRLAELAMTYPLAAAFRSLAISLSAQNNRIFDLMDFSTQYIFSLHHICNSTGIAYAHIVKYAQYILGFTLTSKRSCRR